MFHSSTFIIDSPFAIEILTGKDTKESGSKKEEEWDSKFNRIDSNNDAEFELQLQRKQSMFSQLFGSPMGLTPFIVLHSY